MSLFAGATARTAWEANLENLDYHFLKYIGVNREGQRRVHSFYVPFFQGCRKVADLGCGSGYFVELLEESGIPTTGVDSDSKSCEEASQQGLNVVCQDILDYLRETPSESLDGIFCSHLVEHLNFQQILELLKLCRAALRPGGTIVVTTPNVRSLYAHLEMFYMHFGHVTFYHPNLLTFFLEQRGFSGIVAGENPNLTSLLLGRFHLQELEMPKDGTIPAGTWRWISRLRRRLSRAMAGPYLDNLVTQLNHNIRQSNAAMNTLDCSFECYVKGTR